MPRPFDVRAPVGMKWFRANIKHGSRLALLALALQFGLSFGHFHAGAAQAAAGRSIGRGAVRHCRRPRHARRRRSSQLRSRRPTTIPTSTQARLARSAPSSRWRIRCCSRRRRCCCCRKRWTFYTSTTDAEFVHLNSARPSRSSLALLPPPDIDGLMLPEGIAASCAADPAGTNRNRSVAYRRQGSDRQRIPAQPSGSDNDIPNKTSIPPRWSELAAAVRDGQRRAWRRTQRRLGATQLPEITVTAPSPIVAAQARAVAHARARRARCSRPQSRAGAADATGAGRRRAATGRAADRHRSVRHRHGGAERGNPPRRRRHARRSPVLQARHYRLELCAGRVEPADHPGARRQSRRHRRKRHRQQRRFGSRRRSLRTDRSARDQPGRSDPRTSHPALRIDRDRRRGQRHQQPHSGRAALMRRGAVPDLWPSSQGAAGECASRRPA